MRGRVVLRGTLEVVKSGIPIVVLISIVAGSLRRNVQPGWEMRVGLMLAVALGVWLILDRLLKRWNWLAVQTPWGSEARDA